MKTLGVLSGVPEVEAVLHRVREGAVRFVSSMRVIDLPFGRFRLCHHAHVPHELDAATAGIELWMMLSLPIQGEEREEAIAYLKAFQNPQTGLVYDSAWEGRDEKKELRTWENGDTFFTSTTIEALRALRAHFDHPVRYLINISPNELISKTVLKRSAQNPFTIGDYSVLISHNLRLSVRGPASQWRALLTLLKWNQDSATGFWPRGQVSPPYTPAINRAFHFVRSTWNLVDYPYHYPEAMINSCLHAIHHSDYYKQFDACDDLDLAHILYGATCWSDHRLAEIRAWAVQRLAKMVETQREDGGFSYKPKRAMFVHNKISMSPGELEGDLWGTLMYMGAIKMMAEIAFPEIAAPWRFSHIHRVPGTYTRLKKNILKIKRVFQPGFFDVHKAPYLKRS
jgi:hypothetical protein